MGSNITLTITSCNRHDFLKQTMDTFIGVKCGALKPDACFIYEDSEVPMPDWLRENIHYYSSNLGVVTWFQGGRRRGQVYALDFLYSRVKTDFIFHTEDDFLYLQGGDWMRQSKQILEKYPTISMVSLRGNDCNNHPNIDQPPYEGFKIQMPFWHKVWGGMNYNAGLRRLSDYKRIGSYGRYTTYGMMGLETEIPISELYLKLGYHIAVLPSPNGKYEPYVKHMNVSSRMLDGFVIPLPKILIAIPVCHKFAYTKWESGESPAYDPATAHEGKPYGTDIHISGENDRIAALRDTWLKDVEKFKAHVEYKLFYGQGATREPLADEVFLQVPDDYAHLPHKTVAICKYAKEHGYDFLLKVDDDTAVYMDRVVHEALSSQWDYAGLVQGRVTAGGAGYWLSRRAFTIIADHASSNLHWAEDVVVGRTLFNHGIQPQSLEGHVSGRQDHWFYKNGFDPSVDMSGVTSFHAVRPSDMRAWYACR